MRPGGSVKAWTLRCSKCFAECQRVLTCAKSALRVPKVLKVCQRVLTCAKGALRVPKVLKGAQRCFTCAFKRAHSVSNVRWCLKWCSKVLSVVPWFAMVPVAPLPAKVMFDKLFSPSKLITSVK
eukprot:4232722-Karenia_brevis.AAC.1